MMVNEWTYLLDGVDVYDVGGLIGGVGHGRDDHMFLHGELSRVERPSLTKGSELSLRNSPE